jgi:alkanesulfonate monooxygenase SsuD/methylene tetrahydromethanopterin reductase-like flavin-dependent oxidoreductase (luciferase family)
MFGVGADAAPEWQALGMDTKGRGQRSNEMLVLLNRLWTEDKVTFHGRFYNYEDVTISPKPKQSPLPLWIGGSSDAAIERTAKYGTGWLAGSTQSPAQVGRVIAAIKERAVANGRHLEPDHFGCGLAYRFGTWEDDIVQRNVEALRGRVGPDVDPRAYYAVGGADEIIHMVKVLVAVGASKFVMRPLATDDDDMVEQTRRLNYEVIPTIHAL